jgi:hypothetical protein
MGEPGEPGSVGRKIIRASLMAGLGMALCNCGAGSKDDAQHAAECEISKGRERAAKYLHEELKRNTP